jgi:hypothetical protein
VTYNTVSVTGNNIFGNALGEVVNVAFSPASFYFDTPANTQINAPVAVATSNSAGVWTVSGIIDPTPDGSGMAWKLTVSDKSTGQALYSALVQVAYSNGASQNWLSLTPPPAPANTGTFLSVSGPSTGANQIPMTTGAGSVLTYSYGQVPINVRNFGADPTGVADSTTAIQNAINAATGVLAPSTHSRVPTNSVYIPTGSYKITSDLSIVSTQGFNLYGDGAELTILVASGTGFTTGPVVVDGSYAGRYRGFTIKGDGTEQVTNAFTLTYTTAASRSTTGNLIEHIRVRNLNFVTGINLAGVTNRQVDSTRLDCVVVGGGQTVNAWSSSGNWQQGFVFGNSTFANIYDQVLTRCDASNCYYGMYNNVSSFSLNGSQPANNYCDFYINPGAQTTVTNVQSQNAGQLLISPSNFSPQPVTFNDIQMKSSYLSGASNAFITLGGGYWNFNNVNATNLQISGSYVNGLVSITGSGVNRPCVAIFNNLSMRGPRSGAFALSNAIVSVLGYTNYEPTTGNSTYATGDVASYNQGGSWTTIGGPGVLPAVTYITATGNTTYTIPANSQTLDVLIVGGGAGGSSGAYSVAANAGGGPGGGSGGVSRQQFAVAALTSPVTVTVGAGGNGGAAVTSAGNGNSGIAGTATLFGGYLSAKGGAASSAGSTTLAVTAGGAGGAGTNVSSAGGGQVASASTPTSATGQSTGGGGAGGNAAGTTVASGSNGGTITGIASWGNPSAGVLDVALVTGFPTSGTVTVATSTTPALVSYTGTAAGQLTGCAYVSGGTGTVATGGAVNLAAAGAGCTATVMGTSSNSSTGGVVGGASPTNGSAPAAQGDTAPGGGGGAAAFGASSSAQSGANAQANSGGGGGGGGGNTGSGTTSGAGGNGGSGFALIIAYYQ